MQSPSGSRVKSEEYEEEMKESGVDMSYDIEASDFESSPVPISKAVSSSGQRTPSTVKQKQRMRFQTKLLLLKQEHEQNSGKDDLPQRARKSPLSSTTMFKSTKLPQFAETAAMATHVIDGRRIVTNPLKYQIITSSPLCSQYSVSDPSLDSLGSPLTSPPDQKMKFTIPPQSFSSDVGYIDNASPDSNVTSSSELSEGDNLFLANVVEVKALDEISVEQQEELSQILSQASYGSEGITGLLKSENSRVVLTSSSSCPVVTQPRYRGGRKKEEAPPNMTPEQKVQWEKERQKKDNHNHIERRRRDKINECIRLLSHIVPNGDDLNDVDIAAPVEVGNSADSQKKEYNKKGAVLEASVNYIKRLQTEHRNMDELRQRQAVLERENRRLHLLVQQMTLEAQQREHSSPHLAQHIQVHQQALLQPYSQQHQQHVQQVEVPLGPGDQHQPDLQMIYNQQQQVEMLLSLNQQLPLQVPIQDQRLLEELMNLVQSSDCPVVAGSSSSQFETFPELHFEPLPEEHFQAAVISNQFDDANVMDFSVDDMFTDGNSLQLNSDPLLSTTNSIPDFQEDLYIRLALGK